MTCVKRHGNACPRDFAATRCGGAAFPQPIEALLGARFHDLDHKAIRQDGLRCLIACTFRRPTTAFVRLIALKCIDTKGRQGKSRTCASIGVLLSESDTRGGTFDEHYDGVAIVTAWSHDKDEDGQYRVFENPGKPGAARIPAARRKGTTTRRKAFARPGPRNKRMALPALPEARHEAGSQRRCSGCRSAKLSQAMIEPGAMLGEQMTSEEQPRDQSTNSSKKKQEKLRWKRERKQN